MSDFDDEGSGEATEEEEEETSKNDGKTLNEPKNPQTQPPTQSVVQTTQPSAVHYDAKKAVATPHTEEEEGSGEAEEGEAPEDEEEQPKPSPQTQPSQTQPSKPPLPTSGSPNSVIPTRVRKISKDIRQLPPPTSFREKQLRDTNESLRENMARKIAKTYGNVTKDLNLGCNLLTDTINLTQKTMNNIVNLQNNLDKLTTTLSALKINGFQ
eukprot:TRINITY_DN3971_c0_g1_i1.p1 TRINITY_DN3971_c0_g1~~TRINITY_DN3971_c0_g1_i1.p1  ORF type:complete len:211 (+),score=51.00 TRINITY_DN3971_c0_g1_i1:19-651(+)